MSNDRAWVRATLAGDVSAYELLVREYQDRAYRLALGIVKEPSLAESVCLEAFEKAYHALPRFNGSASFGTWFYRIVLNTARTQYRKSKKARELHVSLDEAPNLQVPSAGAPDSKLLEKEAMGRIRSAVDQLPTKLQSSWILFAMEGMSLAQIAQIEACSVGAVKSRLFNARKRLKKSLRSYFEETATP